MGGGRGHRELISLGSEQEKTLLKLVIREDRNQLKAAKEMRSRMVFPPLPALPSGTGLNGGGSRVLPAARAGLQCGGFCTFVWVHSLIQSFPELFPEKTFPA